MSKPQFLKTDILYEPNYYIERSPTLKSENRTNRYMEMHRLAKRQQFLQNEHLAEFPEDALNPKLDDIIEDKHILLLKKERYSWRIAYNTVCDCNDMVNHINYNFTWEDGNYVTRRDYMQPLSGVIALILFACVIGLCAYFVRAHSIFLNSLQSVLAGGIEIPFADIFSVINFVAVGLICLHAVIGFFAALRQGVTYSYPGITPFVYLIWSVILLLAVIAMQLIPLFVKDLNVNESLIADSSNIPTTVFACLALVAMIAYMPHLIYMHSGKTLGEFLKVMNRSTSKNRRLAMKSLYHRMELIKRVNGNFVSASRRKPSQNYGRAQSRRAQN